MAATATTNGAPTPPEPAKAVPSLRNPDTSDNKRKREVEEPGKGSLDAPSSRNAQTQKDILEILKGHDTTPSFLNYAIDDKSTKERSPKKARLSEPIDNAITISSKLSSGAYASLSGLRRDAQHASESLVGSIRTQARDREGQNAGRLLVDDLKQMQRVQAFEQVIKDVVDQESNYEAAHGATNVKQEELHLANGHVPKRENGEDNKSEMVLTLFGNAPTPKQLFSSMQRPSSGIRDSTIKTDLPVEELSLPNGLAATKIMPLPTDGSKKGPTFEDSFAPAYNLPPLHPPKAAKRSSGRDTTISWEFKEPFSRSSASKKGGYTTQSLTVGDWLGYGGVDPRDALSSPNEKRKQRDRALSGGESSQPPPSRGGLLEEDLAKEEEALFRRAYSSFAPSCDNSKSLVPAETKSMMWWNKVGRRKYNETFAIDPALMDERISSMPNVVPTKAELEFKSEDFSKVIDEMEEVQDEVDKAQLTRDRTYVDEVLRQISELLETLASHQRIRTASLASAAPASRTPISPAPVLASRVGRPDSPAEDEISTYQALRREIAYLILKLPPYAVAKLDGDQLSELGVSKLVTFDGKDTKGTMEEDHVARLAKYTAMATAAGLATLTRTGSNTTTPHYSSTNQRTPAIGQAANTRYGQSAQFGASRTPVQPQYQRSTSNQSTYGTPSATAPRPGYGQQPNQYTRPAQSSYGQTNGQPIYRPSSGYGSYNPQYNQQTPQTQQRPAYPSSQPLAQYQQRSQAAAQNAVAYQTNTFSPQQQQSQNSYNRTASPIKPSGYSQPLQPHRPQQQYAQQPSQQPGSGRATPVNYPSQPQTPVNGFQRPVAPREASGTPQPLQPAAQNGQAYPQINGNA
ncbi:hypothetical protein LTR37_016073 [Vermiconidia calcicola]|uniref:Uncharacterized protein n=1 Tax=Vermiconidia calcicola TaxID=1690605 RepID=A0ACC3MPR6_9PEZI|nr:hypothetical protein LTR37_016073 [Vermiconidia calcicola]